MKTSFLRAGLGALVIGLSLSQFGYAADHVGNVISAAAGAVPQSFPLVCPQVIPVGGLIDGIRGAIQDATPEIEHERYSRLIRVLGKEIVVAGSQTVSPQSHSLDEETLEKLFGPPGSPTPHFQPKPNLSDLVNPSNDSSGPAGALSELYQETEMDRLLQEKIRTLARQAQEAILRGVGTSPQEQQARKQRFLSKAEEELNRHMEKSLEETHRKLQQKLGCSPKWLNQEFFKRKYQTPAVLKKLIASVTKKLIPNTTFPKKDIEDWIQEGILRMLVSPTPG